MSFYKRLIINGTEFLLAVGQTGKGAPTSATPGTEGITYMDTDTGTLYKCTAVSNGVYIWEALEVPSGYYVPDVFQPESGTMTVSYVPSNENLPAIDPVTIQLPAGPEGPKGDAGAGITSISIEEV